MFIFDSHQRWHFSYWSDESKIGGIISKDKTTCFFKIVFRRFLCVKSSSIWSLSTRTHFQLWNCMGLSFFGPKWDPTGTLTRWPLFLPSFAVFSKKKSAIFHFGQFILYECLENLKYFFDWIHPFQQRKYNNFDKVVKYLIS